MTRQLRGVKTRNAPLIRQRSDGNFARSSFPFEQIEKLFLYTRLCATSLKPFLLSRLYTRSVKNFAAGPVGIRRESTLRTWGVAFLVLRDRRNRLYVSSWSGYDVFDPSGTAALSKLLPREKCLVSDIQGKSITRFLLFAGMTCRYRVRQ